MQTDVLDTYDSYIARFSGGQTALSEQSGAPDHSLYYSFNRGLVHYALIHTGEMSRAAVVRCVSGGH